MKNLGKIGLLLIGLGLSFPPLSSAASAKLAPSVTAELKAGIVTLSNDRIQRRFMWNDGNLKSLDLTNMTTGHRWVLAGDMPDIMPFGVQLTARDGKFQTREIPKSPLAPAHLEVEISFKVDRLEVRRLCRIFENIPAINCQLAYRGTIAPQNEKATLSRQMIEKKSRATIPEGDILEHLALPKGHWSFAAVQFSAVTDYNDWLVNEQEGEIYRQDQYVQANIMRFEERIKGEQILMVKEAPIGADQISWPGHDFILRDESVRVVGGGVDPLMLDPEIWREAYGTAIVVAQAGRYEALKSLRQYRESLRTYHHDRDGMILMNTWGDRSRDHSMSEAFALKELSAAHVLGLSHFQLDDGWQQGLSKNSSKKEGKMWESWTTEAWDTHPTRFPNGLGPIIEQAKKYHMEIGLWFNPTSENDYAQWQRDGQILVDLYHKYGVRIFKIDGLEIGSRRAEGNLGKMFRKVYDATKGRVVFNVDVTAGRRLGYLHPLNSYGNIFIENRYTDWGNYYPYRTLRNLWALSAYVPAQFLQVEFLNIWRNKDKYPLDDPYAPSKVSFEYAFATTMMAQPLAWFEASNLPAEALEIADVIKRYRQLAPKIHQGRIYPIGARPDGSSWTGFQSIASEGDHGYLLVFREKNDQPEASITTFLPKNHYACFTPELGSGAAFEAWVGPQSQIQLKQSAAHSYTLYRYKLHPKKQNCFT